MHDTEPYPCRPRTRLEADAFLGLRLDLDDDGACRSAPHVPVARPFNNYLLPIGFPFLRTIAHRFGIPLATPLRLDAQLSVATLPSDAMTDVLDRRQSDCPACRAARGNPSRMTDESTPTVTYRCPARRHEWDVHMDHRPKLLRDRAAHS